MIDTLDWIIDSIECIDGTVETQQLLPARE